MNNKINKIAYPHNNVGVDIDSYDLNKWVKTLESIYIYANKGYDIVKTREQLTHDWDGMEKLDFNHWMKYYQSNSQNSYKTAQYLSVAPGVTIPEKYSPAPRDINDLKPQIKHPGEEDPQFKINKKIKAIIGRLMSAEKLATEPEVQRELAKRLDVGIHKWLEELQRVKRLVQVAPIKHANSSILEDLIIKEANILAHQGFPKTAQELIKIAQDPAAPPPPPPPPAEDPLADPAAAASGGSTPEPPAAPSESKGDSPLEEFEKNLNLENPDSGNSSDGFFDGDFLEIVDEPPDLQGMKIMAQVQDMAPEPVMETEPAIPAQKPKMAPKPEIVVEEEPADTIVHKKTDDLIENALSSITVEDVIERLDTLVNLFRTREIPRQLAIIDLMMDQLNLSSFFPGLAEASSKSLESNQYALTRIEEVLSKLKGSIKNTKGQELDLLGQKAPSTGDAALEGIRSGLQEQVDKEKSLKQKRKIEEQAKLEAPPPPSPPAEIEVEEDLSQPVELAEPVAAPASAPAAKPVATTPPRLNI